MAARRGHGNRGPQCGRAAPGSVPSGFTGRIGLRRLVVVEQDAVRRPVQIVELPGLERPQESAQAEEPEKKGEGDQNDDNVHGRTFDNRKALPVTMSDELDIATAAMSGVMKPIIASGTVTAL